MKAIILSLLIVSSLFSSQSEEVFQNLLQKVKVGYKEQTKLDKQREINFLRDVKNQKKVLEKLKQKVKKAKQVSKKLRIDIRQNETKLQKASNDLDLTTGDLGEVFGTVKQISSDMNVHVKNSFITSHFPDRKTFFEKLSSKKELPNISELEKMWYLILQEIVESGKIVKYQAAVITKEGKKNIQDIIRLGTFNVLSKDSFLKYDGSKFMFIEPSNQPGYKYVSKVSKFFNSKEKIEEVIIDPSKGTILELITQKPTFKERISQGGVIGYIIIGLGLIGVSFAFVKYIWLSFMYIRIKKQLKNVTKININNPLGRILKVYENNKNLSNADLEYRVDEAFFREIPPIQSGFSMVTLFAATTPLLGLLGTVTGMILTFQSITLFGTSDPKLMAGGISQALITTMLGLIAAIPLLFTNTLLRSKSKKIINILEQNSIALIAKKTENHV